MTDLNCHSEMTKFHNQKVTLSNEQQDEMRRRRDAGRTRLKSGLNANKHPQPKELHSQGSYQMRTMTQDVENDYDIDDGAYFYYDDLTDDNANPLTPLATRKRIYAAIERDGRLKEKPKIKRNCVRQEYPEGYHIDIPAYRIVTTENHDGDEIEYYELASGDEWVESDARAVTRWYNNLVTELNAGQPDGSQMRRVTKLTKKFARRSYWKKQTTSGICITKLVVDHFIASKDAGGADHDDKALRETWKGIKKALDVSTEIDHPVLDNAKLAETDDPEVTFFRGCLTEALVTLEILDDPNCTRQQAREAWDRVFDTSFFTDLPNNDTSKKSEGLAFVVKSKETARRNDGGGRFG